MDCLFGSPVWGLLGSVSFERTNASIPHASSIQYWIQIADLKCSSLSTPTSRGMLWLVPTRFKHHSSHDRYSPIRSTVPGIEVALNMFGQSHMVLLLNLAHVKSQGFSSVHPSTIQAKVPFLLFANASYHHPYHSNNSVLPAQKSFPIFAWSFLAASLFNVLVAGAQVCSHLRAMS